jgi:glyoxylase-like metal-dependent hydrolase (beta-lactamase superfamily II)
MSVFFRTLRSGSSGNSQLLYWQGSAILIDLGLPARTALKQTMAELRQRGVKLLGALITHEHGDHFAAGAIRAMSGLAVPVYAPRSAVAFAEEQLRIGVFSGRPEFRVVDEGEAWERPFSLGPFHITPVEVTHHPGGSCYAYSIAVESQRGPVRVVVATDLCHERSLPAHLVDADLIYLESNHDPELLRLRPNAGSHFHLPNGRCGRLLQEARRSSRQPPAHVFLGHLSELRNTPTLAEHTVREAFSASGTELDFPLTSAPRHHPSVTVEVPPRAGR